MLLAFSRRDNTFFFFNWFWLFAWAKSILFMVCRVGGVVCRVRVVLCHSRVWDCRVRERDCLADEVFPSGKAREPRITFGLFTQGKCVLLFCIRFGFSHGRKHPFFNGLLCSTGVVCRVRVVLCHSRVWDCRFSLVGSSH